MEIFNVLNEDKIISYKGLFDLQKYDEFCKRYAQPYERTISILCSDEEAVRRYLLCNCCFYTIDTVDKVQENKEGDYYNIKGDVLPQVFCDIRSIDGNVLSIRNLEIMKRIITTGDTPTIKSHIMLMREYMECYSFLKQREEKMAYLKNLETYLEELYGLKLSKEQSKNMANCMNGVTAEATLRKRLINDINTVDESNPIIVLN